MDTPSFLDRFDEVDLEEADYEKLPPTLAERRRRTLLVLLFSAFACLAGGQLGPPIIRWVGVVLLLLAVGFVAHCRRQAILRAQQRGHRPARPRLEERRAAAPHVAGIPVRMPARPAPLSAALPAPAARYDEPVAAPIAAARAAIGGDWEPRPVPLPTYVGKAKAPARPRKVLDLTRPGEWTAALEGDEELLAELADTEELDVILERRRAVGGW